MNLLNKFKNNDDNNNGEGVFKSVFVAYFILVMHITLIAGIGLLVLFFSGIITYMLWIFLGGSGIILGMGYMLYRRMKKEGRSLQEVLSLPEFAGKSVEVSLLGGLASVKVGQAENNAALPYHQAGAQRLIEPPPTVYVHDLTELAKLFEKDLITKEEFQKAKEQILFFALTDKRAKM